MLFWVILFFCYSGLENMQVVDLRKINFSWLVVYNVVWQKVFFNRNDIDEIRLIRFLRNLLVRVEW